MLFNIKFYTLIFVVILTGSAALPALASQKAINRPITQSSDGRSIKGRAIQKKFAPLADHHLHLYSPASVELSTPPLPPRIKLPEDLENFVRERERRWNDQNALAELYTEDAIYFRGGTAGWARGRKAVAGYVKWTISDTPYYVKPTS